MSRLHKQPLKSAREAHNESEIETHVVLIMAMATFLLAKKHNNKKQQAGVLRLPVINLNISLKPAATTRPPTGARGSESGKNY